MVGFHHALLGRNTGAFDQRQQIALHTFPAHRPAATLLRNGDLVDLIQKDNAVVLRAIERFLH